MSSEAKRNKAVSNADSEIDIEKAKALLQRLTSEVNKKSPFLSYVESPPRHELAPKNPFRYEASVT